MTDDTPEVAADAAPADDSAAQDDTAEQPTEVETEQPDPTGAEAARYRRRLRETEKETEAITARVQALQRQQIERHADHLGLVPAALWATTDMAPMLREDGTVDLEAVSAAVKAARAELGITTSAPASPAAPTLLDAFTPRTRR